MMIYRPYRYDFKNLKYFYRDFPEKVVVQIEQLYCNTLGVKLKNQLRRLGVTKWNPTSCVGLRFAPPNLQLSLTPSVLSYIVFPI